MTKRKKGSLMLVAETIKEVALHVVQERSSKTPAPLWADLSAPAHIAALGRKLLSEESSDRGYVFLLDDWHRLVAYGSVARGESSAARDALRIAVVHDCPAIVLCALRPDGDVAPRKDDYPLTHKLLMAGRVLGVALYDHVLVSPDEHYSFREFGLIPTAWAD